MVPIRVGKVSGRLTISLADELPEDLQIDDLLFAENIDAYTIASTTYFNGFPPPKVVHLNK